MEINIHDKRKIHEIQQDFSNIFPNLKLEFFHVHEHSTVEPYHHKLLVHPSKELGECLGAVHSKGTVVIKPEMTVQDLKKGFKESFGLHVRVFRKVGDDWLEAITDHLPLNKHNDSTYEANSESTLERI
jgi:hypothetical protein